MLIYFYEETVEKYFRLYRALPDTGLTLKCLIKYQKNIQKKNCRYGGSFFRYGGKEEVWQTYMDISVSASVIRMRTGR